MTVAAPLVRDVVDWDEFVGRFEAIQSVEVRPRATGYLQGIWFKDGQYVRKGQLLFTIDPRPAQAAVAQAAAQVAQAKATLANAQTEYARSEALVAQRAASQEELEQRRAALRSGSAQVAAAEANLRARQLDLGFTRVVAPISGRISERKVDVGNTVATDQTVLTTIVSVDPVHFVFQGSEALLLKYQRDGSGTQNGTPIKVKLSDESDYTHNGTIDFVDNALDAGAGTIRARAVIANPGGFLKAGMFGSARLEASKPYPAMLVPDTAIMADAARQIVFVVDKTNTVTARPVQTGPLQGSLRVIRSGLNKDDRVVIDGAQRARPGVKVTPQPGQVKEAAPAAKGPNDAPDYAAQPANKR
ncbi:efflux RND transporter periplasmic adaptor subunit [Sphingomonas sp. NIBR02145]|uniref:efflux RND transporter periplasmic adaptor subunit n=1 Tax=Sphingomonas sp. NIBR02145 TaxID=3014784 RepID=UPI0022B58F63|nr:efflux RND transporter periplasmic adaptor subunit [Sphingomonas sp. NIBR02145]WHU02276.1 efflux RND transporter periplasmic adaptor subunit [Sphingomonas sp. NIBR02145]